MLQGKQVFLSAEWRDLVMLNYEVDGRLLHDYVPRGTVLDSFAEKTYVSLVGFQFRRTRLFGSLPIPFHTDFEEVNLRFYVRRKDGKDERRGVVFIAEIVPKRVVAQVARLAYRENYICLPMKHRIDINGGSQTAEYHWRRKGVWSKLYAQATGAPAPAEEGSSNSSSPSTIGAIPPSEMAGCSNTRFRTRLGIFGRAASPGWKEIRAVSTAASWERYFDVALILPS
jgi:uncharacterized protein